MAHTDQLEKALQESIADRIAQSVPRLTSIIPRGPGYVTELSESFAVFQLDEEALKSSDDMGSSVKDTKSWYHQITSSMAGAPGAPPVQPRIVGYARSETQSSNQQQLLAVGEVKPGFDLPNLIRKTVEWIDENATADPVVRLVVIPERYMHCFWLKYDDHDNVVVIDMPTKYKYLSTFKIYDLPTFRALLEKEAQITPLPRR
jgi:hypothetical protein